ncbi:hypothetical protein CRUP_013280, partial [Coryphaenoides rupestris]
VLTLYFVQYLHWDKDLSTAVYHAFNSLCYFTPVLGALIADSWLAEKLVQQKMEAIQEKVHLGQPVEGEYLTHLLLSDQMNLEEILASITELLVAGVDTTSNTMAWALYLLARDPEVQERLYPVVPGNACLTVEKEIMVGGYLFPKKTVFHLCHYAVSYDEKVFPEPHAFRPSRWLRADNTQSKNHPFGSIPFGIQACLGDGRSCLDVHSVLHYKRMFGDQQTRPELHLPAYLPLPTKVAVSMTPVDVGCGLHHTLVLLRTESGAQELHGCGCGAGGRLPGHPKAATC